MNYQKMILERLLDKFEERKAGSRKRVLISCSKKEVSLPDMESTEYPLFVEEMQEMKNEQLIDFNWSLKNHIIHQIWLNLENVSHAYQILNRETPEQQTKNAVRSIDAIISGIQTGWIKEGLQEDKSLLLEKNKLFGIWKQPEHLRMEFLKALCYVDNLSENTVTMRACSIQLYSDSKYFEHEIKKYLVSWIRKHEPIFRDMPDADKLEEREILDYVGILMMPEVFEFCGNICIEFPEGITDFSPMKSGSCIMANCVSDIQHIRLDGIKKILFIENRTNYAEYCVREKMPEELVIYHGGFYSPKRGKFFQKIYDSISQIPSYFWADIDYGGFQMYHRLKNNIVPDLRPYRMDKQTFYAHCSHGLLRSETYIRKVAGLLNHSDFAMFHEVIQLIVQEKKTIEQETFLI